ncbi:hypothetical protein ACSFB8_02915 [Enterococcus faecalis]
MTCLLVLRKVKLVVLAKSKADEQAYQAMIQALQQFVNEDSLDTKACTNGKQFYQAVLIPFIRAGTLLSEAIADACQKFVDEYQATVDSGDLQSDVLEETIRQLDDRISQLDAIRATIEQSDLGDNFKL